MLDDIIKNIIYLSENLANWHSFLDLLENECIITKNEREEIQSRHRTPLFRNSELFQLVQSKDWSRMKNSFISILRISGNGRCADVIEGIRLSSSIDKNNCLQTGETKDFKWWPMEKKVAPYFYEKKLSNKLLVHKLYQLLLDHKTIVITQKSSPFMAGPAGGIGKSMVTAWFAKYYENDYDHIIWITCEGGKIYQSIEQMSKYLKLERKDYFTFLSLAEACLEKLSAFKCLVIFDKAGNCAQDEDVRNILANNRKPNLHFIITAEKNEWPDLKFVDFQLDVLNVDESVELFRKKLKSKPKLFLVKELCWMLGNVPLALQMALSMLNNYSHQQDCNNSISLNDRQQISIETLTRQLKSSDQVEDHTHSLDELQMTLVRLMQISLDRIWDLPNGGLVVDVLFLFSQIQIFSVELEYLAAVQKVSLREIEYSVNVLESFAFLYRNGTLKQEADIGDDVRTFQVVSLPKLLHDPLKYLARHLSREIIVKILRCKKFVTNKLQTYIFTEREKTNLKLRCNLDHVTTDLIKRVEDLMNLFGEKRFEEALELSRTTHQYFLAGPESEHLCSLYNYCICLFKCGHLEESLKKFMSLSKLVDNLVKIEKGRVDLRILGLRLNNIPDVVAVHLWCIHLREQVSPYNASNDTRMELLLEEVTQWPSILITGNELPVNFSFVHNIKDVILNETKIRFDVAKIREGGQEEIVAMENLKLSNAIFITPSFGEIMEKIDLHSILAQTKIKRLVIDCNDRPSTIIRVDFSKFPLTVDTVNLYGTEISCSGDSSCVKNVEMCQIRNPELLNQILSKCPHLEYLKLSRLGEEFTLDLSVLPRNLKNVTLYEVAVNQECPHKFEKLSLRQYKFSSQEDIGILKNLLKRTSSEMLILDFSNPWLNDAEKPVLKQGLALINLIERVASSHPVVIFGGIDWKIHDLQTRMKLAKYGIKGRADFHLLNEGEGRELSPEEYFAHIC